MACSHLIEFLDARIEWVEKQRKNVCFNCHFADVGRAYETPRDLPVRTEVQSTTGNGKSDRKGRQRGRHGPVEAKLIQGAERKMTTKQKSTSCRDRLLRHERRKDKGKM